MREKAKRTFQVPHTYTIIFILMIIVAVMTWVVPSGTFATTEIDGREVTVAGTYEQMDKTFVDGETGKQVDLRQGPGAVSYTHLDVYKRQVWGYLYQGNGNVGEAMAFGRISARSCLA